MTVFFFSLKSYVSGRRRRKRQKEKRRKCGVGSHYNT
jgi:hypothetical protein